jgi:hypothetical protein
LAALYSLVTLPDGLHGVKLLMATIALRMATGAVTGLYLGDYEGLRTLWLLPVRDLAGAATWAASFLQRKVYWKGRVFVLSGNRLVESA